MRTDRHTPESSHAFEARLSRGLEHIAAQTPTSNPLEFDPEALPLVVVDIEQNRRLVPYLTAAAAAAVVVTGIVAITSRTDGQPAATAPVTAASGDTTLATTPLAVRGVPICGAELPVTIEMDVSGNTSGPITGPGPVAGGTTAEGQFAQYWQLASGTVEVRWPADPRQKYDLDSTPVRVYPSVFDGMAVSTQADGSQAIVALSNLGGVTLTMTKNAGADGLAAPCDVLQVRYSDSQGNQTTRGYNVTDFNSDPAFGLDLNPLIISTEASAGPDPATVVSCGEGGIDNDMTGPASPSAADALLAFLDSGQFPGLITSGYSEYTPSDTETIYAIITDDRLITLITVTHTTEGWTVTHVKAPGC
ncbi:MAG TPA: hypothetical protein PK020_12160 [Ilumatobacteraceae bacterium]|nr:hypothetical protein [Ilumatobacteraceae bacterium]HRB03535.1 hypothetical protein [Ilumatobacteraceae bacterium]